MINFLNKLLILQSDVKPRLLKTLEVFTNRFGADFILLVFPEETREHHSKETIFFGKEPSVPDHFKMIIDYARIEIKGDEPVLLDGQSILKNADNYETYIFIPIDLADGPRCIITLGFLEPLNFIPASYMLIAYELMYIRADLLFQQALSKENEHNAFLLSFGKALGEVRDCKQLFYLLESTLKPFIGYTDCTIFLLDTDRELMNNLCQDSESELPQLPFHDSINVASVPFYGILDNKYAGKVKEETFDFKKLIENTEISPFLKTDMQVGAHSGQIFNLYSGREIIGNCVFVFGENHHMNDDFHCIIPLIINQLASVVMNIKSIREIEKKSQERDILQSINTGIAFNKDKLTLLKSINPKLRLLIDYSHHFVKAINEDQLTVTGLLGDLDSSARFHPDYAYMVSTKFLISDQVFKVLLSNDPIIFDLDEQLASGNPIPLYMSINYECGIRKMAMISLRVGSKIIGIWVICLLEGQDLSPYQLELLKGISHQLSIAAENIKAADIVSKKNKEREFLSNISLDITSIRERKDLDKLFNLTLKNQLAFQEAVVMIKNEKESYNKFLYTPEMYGSDPGHDVDFSGERYQLNDAIFCKLMKAGGVLVYDMNKLMEEETIPSYIRSEYASGIRIKIGVKLVRDKADIGAVFFNFTGSSTPEEPVLELYNSISYHLSTAISNVLLNEEVIKRENERELLFSLSTEIASIRNGNQLIRIITEKLKGFLGFSYIAIGTISDTGENFDIIQFDPESICRNHPEYKDLVSMIFPVNDGVINKILTSPVPLSFDLEELSSKQDLTSYLRISKESGIKQVVGVRFFKDLSPFGSLVLFFEKEMVLTSGKSSLINGLGNQISIAVTNINSNKELQRRVDEEGKLLLFSAELRSVKDINVLAKILKVQLKELFQICEYTISVLSEDKKSHRELIRQDADVSYQAEKVPAALVEFQSISESVFEAILNSEEMVLFDAKNLSELGPHTEFLNAAAESNKQGIIGSIIKLGQQPVGFMLFQNENVGIILRQRKLFESISSQIAIVISNILSHQKIETQLHEIEAYRQQLEEEKIYLTEEIETFHNYTEIIGESTALKDTFRLISQVASSDSTVLILGETGTGKELIARAIHNNSPRKNKLMVKVNCAALPANLIESELFGHERGSFTGATERRLGKFELANNGTLFLDEIGEMPVDLQVKLLRALQEREIERVGGKETIKVDVRIIAATNRDLDKEIAEGRFRNDLYYRLNIFPIALPPLRDRKQDIEQLAMHFIKQFNKNCGKNINSISTKAMQELMDYDWPGNIRELEHLIERSVLLTNGNVLKQLLLPPPEEQLAFKAQLEDFSLKTIDENEKDYILKVLKHCKGRIAGHGGAAQILGVPPTTLNSKIKRLGIKREHTM